MRGSMVSGDEVSAIDVPTQRGSGITMDTRTRTLGADGSSSVSDGAEGEREGHGDRVAGRSIGVFHNTYYSFPNEADYGGDTTTVFDAACKAIADVPKAFHDKLCVQGSGRLMSGQTISFAKRNCACASECPRSKQRICFEALSPEVYPWGRGALGKPITPLRTIAVDSKVIPLNTAVYIPAFAGQPMSDEGTHDGCFFAEDRGMKVVGHSVDVFAGGETDLRVWNRLVPTGTGVEVFVGDPECDAVLASTRES